MDQLPNLSMKHAQVLPDLPVDYSLFVDHILQIKDLIIIHIYI